MRRVKSEPTLNRLENQQQPRPLSRRFVVASMIDLAMPRISATVETAVQDAVTKVFDAPPAPPESVKIIRSHLEK